MEGEVEVLRGAGAQPVALRPAVALPRDPPVPWEAATPERRGDPARLIFREVEVRGDRVVAVVPQPDFAPFFAARAVEEGLFDANEHGAPGATP